MNKDLYSVKMRASRKENGRDQHISGAEKIVMEDKLDTICRQLLERALHHAKGRVNLINLKIEKVSQEDVMVVDALPVSTCEVNTGL